MQIQASSCAVWSGRQGIPQVHCVVDCLAERNHSEPGLYLQHMRAELKGGQTEDKSVTSEAPQTQMPHSKTAAIFPNPVSSY